MNIIIGYYTYSYCKHLHSQTDSLHECSSSSSSNRIMEGFYIKDTPLITDTPLIEDTQTEVSDYKDENLGIVNIYQIDSDATPDEIQGKFQSIHDNIMRLDKENKELKGKVRALEEENTELKRRVRALEENTELKEKVTVIEEENTELKRKVTVTEEENTELKEKVRALEEENTKLKEKVTKLDAEVKESKQKFESLRNDILTGEVVKGVERKIIALLGGKGSHIALYNVVNRFDNPEKLIEERVFRSEDQVKEANKRWKKLRGQYKLEPYHVAVMLDLRGQRNERAHPQIDPVTDIEEVIQSTTDEEMQEVLEILVPIIKDHGIFKK